MHDLFRDVVLLHGEHDPCDVLHVSSSMLDQRCSISDARCG
jgi:hypothetical protein